MQGVVIQKFRRKPEFAILIECEVSQNIDRDIFVSAFSLIFKRLKMTRLCDQFSPCALLKFNKKFGKFNINSA